MWHAKQFPDDAVYNQGQCCFLSQGCAHVGMRCLELTSQLLPHMLSNARH